jgi:two-component system OmpR family sensor kinase
MASTNAAPTSAAGKEAHRTGAPSSRVRLSARTRILGWSMLLLTVSLLAGAAATHVLLNGRADARIAAELQHEVDEFNALPAPSAAVGSGVTAKLRVATARAVPESEIVLIGVVNGRVYSVSNGADGTDLHLPASQLAEMSALSGPSEGNMTIAGQPARFATLPVRVAGDPNHGAFITAVMTGPERSAVWRITQLQLEVGAASLLLASFLAWLAAGRVLRPIRATTTLARSITDADLTSRIPVRGHDEVSQMAATFNAMLDRLQNAFTAQQRFLADAGHELRTPITIIQGNLDTLAPTDADEVETLAIVAEELSRMTRLVDELSLLAASERPDFLRPAPTDLGALAISLTAKAQALGDRGWRLHSTMTGWAMLDAQRITQAVMQLAANAVAHTRNRTVVDLECLSTPAGLSFHVIDHGEGVAIQDRSRVFDRFTQLNPHRAERTGLGLAIVKAIAAAHSGSISLTETPGGGASFALQIPFRAARSPARGPVTAVAVGSIS